MQVSDVIDMKEDELNPTVLTVVLSEERGHVYQFQTGHDLAVFRSESCMTAYLNQHVYLRRSTLCLSLVCFHNQAVLQAVY